MLPLQTQSTDPGPSNSPGGEEICRKYIWGTCNKYEQCKYRHELDVEIMKDILRFCHDYQNKKGCVRENCNYLHATKEEQNIFLSTGQLPKVLAERHAALAATASNMQTNAPVETFPQIGMFISGSYMTQPPPAPWPPLSHQAVLPPVSTAPPPSSPPRHASTLLPIQQAQQPPTLQAHKSSIGQLVPGPTTYPASQPPPVVCPMNQAPAMNQPPAIFDVSRPPPPIPSQMQSHNNGQLKRKPDSNRNAGSSKIRKPDGSELTDNHCENCVQREIRIEGYKHQMETLHSEEETEILSYTKTLQEYEIGKDLLKKIVGQELFTIFDNLIEGNLTPQLDNAGSFLSGSSTVSKQALLQLFQMWLGGNSRNITEPVPSTSRVNDTLQSLTSLSRRLNVTDYTNTGPDLIKFVTDTLRNNSSTPERDTSVEERPMEPAGMNRSNGFMANGQKAPGGGMGETALFGHAAAGAQSQEYGARALSSYSGPGPSGFAAAAPALAPPPPAAYPMFHPAVPPPPRSQYYSQSPAGPGISNMPYNGVERVAGPSSFQGMMPPSTSAVIRPGQGNAPNYNYMARYPQPPYFPPYQ